MLNMHTLDSMSNLTARRALRRWLDEPGRTRTALAAALGVSAPAVSVWLSGPSVPSPWLRGPLEALTGVPASAWQSRRERAHARLRSGATP